MLNYFNKPSTRKPPRERSFFAKDRLSIQFSEQEEALMALSDETMPKSFNSAKQSKYALDWMEAIKSEFQGLWDRGTFELVKMKELPNKSKIIGSTLILSIKETVDGQIDRFKARLCALGNQLRDGIDYSFTFAPTMRCESLNIFLSICADKDLEIMQVDVKQAYLYFDLKEEVFMRIPRNGN